ncbi:MAG: succinylglutamate desuccinylase/aspartoacylase family protein [Alphaproteobacteria bacterium]|nr:succinylglutamate desuccinylase/aspartoacylase family protein [Alphaproteobacteria bacterium]
MQEEYPVELGPIDISAYAAGNTGIPYVTSFDSGKSGPHVMVNALTHGNEVCGAHALDLLFRSSIRPRRGRLTLSFANVAAYESFDRAQPSASRYLDEDFNRVWTDAVLDGPRQSRELARAREMRPLLRTVDYLLDIHSMQAATAPLMLCGLQAKGRRLAEAVGVPVLLVADAGHSAGARMRDYNDFADEGSPRTALLVECGQHWEKSSRTVAIECMLRFLLATGCVQKGDIASHVADAAPPPQRFVRVTDAVTIETDNFRFTQDFLGLEIIARRGTVIAHDGERPVATPYDDCILIMPNRRLQKGQTAVRLGSFVE